MLNPENNIQNFSNAKSEVFINSYASPMDIKIDIYVKASNPKPKI